jgi:hypothetical protein
MEKQAKLYFTECSSVQKAEYVIAMINKLVKMSN